MNSSFVRIPTNVFLNTNKSIWTKQALGEMGARACLRVRACERARVRACVGGVLGGGEGPGDGAPCGAIMLLISR